LRRKVERRTGGSVSFLKPINEKGDLYLCPQYREDQGKKTHGKDGALPGDEGRPPFDKGIL